MANTVVPLIDSTNRYVVKVFGDASEARTLKVDPGSLKYALSSNGSLLSNNTNRLGCYALRLQKIAFDIQQGDTSSYLRISTNGDSPNVVWTASESGSIAFDEGTAATINVAACTANSTGNIFFDFVCQGTNSAYSAVLYFSKSPNHFDAGQNADPAAFNQGRWRGPG